MRSREVHSDSREERKKKLLEYFDECVAAGDEGLVVKNLSSTYFVGERSREQKKWIKMKPDYSDEVESLDLLILGAYYSEGTRRAGQLSHFLIGVRDDHNPELWLHIGKVGSGFTDAELAKFRRIALQVSNPAHRAQMQAKIVKCTQDREAQAKIVQAFDRG